MTAKSQLSEMKDLTILAIDTSGKTASCAVLRDGVVLGETSVYTRLTHSQVILPFVKRLLGDVNLALDDIDVIAAANGPGSYTGLRIGIAMVKGLCFDGKRCIGVSTLEGLAANCLAAKARVFAVMSARPGIVYFGAYDSDGERLDMAVPDGVTELEKLKEYAADYSGEIILVGDCAQFVKQSIFTDDSRIRLAPTADILQKASGIAQAALWHIDEAGTADTLNARYLQITKAEKDLLEKNK